MEEVYINDNGLYYFLRSQQIQLSVPNNFKKQYF